MQKYTFTIFLIIITLTISFPSYGISEELFFTYAGVLLQGGINAIRYEGWIINKQTSMQSKGIVYGGGFILSIFVKQLCGEFITTYQYSSSDSTPNLSIAHSVMTLKGKYYYPLSTVIQPGVGVGIYFDTPPFSTHYNGGAGGNITLSTLFTLSSEIKTAIDIYCQYGNFGIGESSKKIEGGILASVVYKVGRL